MVDLYSLLAGSASDENDYLAKDPFFTSGLNIARIQTPAPTSNTEAFLLPLLQGALSGGLMGYGRREANQTAYKDYSSLPLLQSLRGNRPVDAPFGPMTEEQASPYQLDSAPEGWTPKQGKSDFLMALVGQQAAQKEEERKEEIKAQTQAAVEQRISMLPVFQKEQEIKGSVNPSGTKLNVNTGGLGQTAADELSKSTALIDEMETLSNALSSSGKNWVEFQALKQFTGLDKEGLGIQLSNLSDRMARARTGAALNKKEEELYGNMIKGDITGTPDQVGGLLKKLAASEARYVKSRVKFTEEMQSGGFEPLKSRMDALIDSSTPKIARPDPSQYSSFEQFKAAKDAWRATNGG